MARSGVGILVLHQVVSSNWSARHGSGELLNSSPIRMPDIESHCTFISFYKETARNLLDVRIILAALWISGMLCSLNGDTYRLSDPISLQALPANTGPLEVGDGFLLGMSIIFTGYIFWVA